MGERIRSRRRELYPGHGGAARAAEAARLEPAQWSTLENGYRRPDRMSHDLAERVARALRVNVEWLKHGTGPREAAPRAGAELDARLERWVADGRFTRAAVELVARVFAHRGGTARLSDDELERWALKAELRCQGFDAEVGLDVDPRPNTRSPSGGRDPAPKRRS